MPAKDKKRNKKIVERYLDGEGFAEIARDYGISRQRVHQIVAYEDEFKGYYNMPTKELFEFVDKANELRKITGLTTREVAEYAGTNVGNINYVFTKKANGARGLLNGDTKVSERFHKFIDLVEERLQEIIILKETLLLEKADLEQKAEDIKGAKSRGWKNPDRKREFKTLKDAITKF